MKVTTFAKFGIGLTAAALVAGALVTPAQADPSSTSDFGTLVGFGSDTTENIMNGIASAIGGVSPNPRIASYDATGSSTVVTRSGGTAVPRPNGSGAGLGALGVAIGASASFSNGGSTWNSANTLGQFDFARSSSGPTVVPGGVLTFIPFARDAVDYATAASTYIPALTIGSASDSVTNHVGPNTLYSIYHGIVTQIVTDSTTHAFIALVDNSYVAGAGEELTPIHAYIPQSGSGTRKFWEGASVLNITDSTVNSGGIVFDQVVTGGSYNGSVWTAPTPVAGPVSVQEHNGSALVGDKGAIMPFSAGKWIAAANAVSGVTDTRNGAVLGLLAGVSPLNGSGPYSLNPTYSTTNAAVTRLVYNIVPTAAVSDVNSLTNWAFAGTGSLVCSQKDTIALYGFGVLTATSGVNACGDTSRLAVAASVSTTTVSAPASVVFGQNFTATATVTSVGNGGGTVSFYDGATLLGTKTLAAGATSDANESVDFVVTNTATHTALESYAITATFTPNLMGVADSTSSPSPVTVSQATAVVKGAFVHATVHSTTSGSLKITVTSVGSIPTGTITIKEGTVVRKINVTLGVDGKVTAVLPRLKIGTHKLTVYYSGSTAVHSAKSATIILKVIK
jgi:hypothetical protein